LQAAVLQLGSAELINRSGKCRGEVEPRLHVQAMPTNVAYMINIWCAHNFFRKIFRGKRFGIGMILS